MIVVDGQKLKFLLAGRTLTVEVHQEYRKGRDYAVGKTVRKATCRAIVEDIEQTGGKTWRVTLKQAREHKPVWLAGAWVQADYTDQPSRAVLEEPEPIDQADLERIARHARERDDLIRRERARQERLSRWREKRGRAA